VFEKTGSASVAEKCLDKDPQLLGGIIADPAGFYVNVFTSEHPRGALRGQLAVA
jgi:CHRD domain